MIRPSASRIGDTVSEIGIERSILAAADGLEVVEAIAAANAGQRLVFLGLAILRDQPPDRRADHLGGGVAEHPLGRLVPGLDDAVEVLADDRVVGGLDDGGEAARDAIAIASVKLTAQQDDAGAVAGLEGKRRDGQRARAVAVLAVATERLDITDRFAGHRAPPELDVLCPLCRRHDDLDRAAGGVGFGPSVLLFGAVVPRDNEALGIDTDDGVAGELGEDTPLGRRIGREDRHPARF